MPYFSYNPAWKAFSLSRESIGISLLPHKGRGVRSTYIPSPDLSCGTTLGMLLRLKKSYLISEDLCCTL
uniref:Uncharacterized protein n=1 Tax=Solanum tuberosum TaxID=4113 RepID=M1APP1_SOLTU